MAGNTSSSSQPVRAVVALLSSFLLAFSYLSAQVVIREKVEISPKSKPRDPSEFGSSTSSTIPYPKVIVQVDPDTIPLGGTTTVFVQVLDPGGVH